MKTVEELIQVMEVSDKHRATPPQAFTDPNVYDKEIEKIYHKEWICIGRQGSIPKPGNFLTATIGKRPVFAIRQKDGSVKAFANVCRHRHAKLVEGVGQKVRISCPYHAWTYDIAGNLINVPHKDGFPAKVCQQKLPEIRSEIWNGFIYVTFNNAIKSVAERLKDLNEFFKTHNLDKWHDGVFEEKEPWAMNWKVMFETFFEAYHLDRTHPNTVCLFTRAKNTEMVTKDHPHFNLQYNWDHLEDGSAPVFNTGVDEQYQNNTLVVGIYPNTLIALTPDRCWWIALQPETVESCNGVWGISISPQLKAEPDGEEQMHAFKEVIVDATKEDKHSGLMTQQGYGYNDEPGYLHNPFENYMAEFRNYLVRQLKAD